MKTQVEITQDINQCKFKIGDKGFIDGYINAADNRPYAIVVVDGLFDFVPIYALKQIN